MALAEKYAPNTLNQITGNEDSVDKLVKFGMEAHNGGSRKPILIFGPSGTGKTTAAHALAYSNGFEILEMNASDYRDAETLANTLIPASKSFGLFSRKLLIILDEIDERSDKFDAGSEKVISQLVKESRHPIVFIASDYWDRKISFLRESVEKIEFKRVNREDLKKLLGIIVRKEGAQIQEEIVDQIIARSNGDIRGAINDLELMIGARPELLENIGMRDRKLEVFGVLDKIFLSKNFDTAREAAMNTDLDSDMLINWVDENVPNRYSWRSDMITAYNNLAKASFFLGQASRKSYYGYLRYSSVLMSSGVSLAPNGEVTYLRSYAFPNNIRQLSKSKASRNAVSGAIVKLVYTLHAHKKDIFSGYLQMLKSMIKEGTKEVGEEETVSFFEKTYGLDGKDIDAILASN
ncbi:MAG: replication factor C large subunit [Candidatus Micrarchaeales archaeon]